MEVFSGLLVWGVIIGLIVYAVKKNKKEKEEQEEERLRLAQKERLAQIEEEKKKTARNCSTKNKMGKQEKRVFN